MVVQLQQLAYFLAVAETRHFTRAADQVRVAQPSLSKQIKNLERELGAPLFSRSRGNVALTPAGETLLPLARRIRADVADHPLVMFREGYDLRDTTLAACGRAGVEPRYAVEGGEMDAVLRFVEAGLGVAVVPSIVVAGRPQFRATPFAPPGLTRTIA